MNKITVCPINTYRDWDQEDDTDIIVLEENTVTEVTVAAVRWQIAEKIWDVAVAGATNANYGPYRVSEIKAAEDGRSFSFQVDTTPGENPLHHDKVFHNDYHSISFSIGFGKLPRSLERGEVGRKNSFLGFHLTTTSLIQEDVQAGSVARAPMELIRPE